jgi:hypothetical protein
MMFLGIISYYVRSGLASGLILLVLRFRTLLRFNWGYSLVALTNLLVSLWFVLGQLA